MSTVWPEDNWSKRKWRLHNYKAGTVVSLNRWRQGGFLQQKPRWLFAAEGWVWRLRDVEIYCGVESTIVNIRWQIATRPFLFGPCVLSYQLSCFLVVYHMGRGGMPFHDSVGVNCKMNAATDIRVQASVWAREWIHDNSYLKEVVGYGILLLLFIAPDELDSSIFKILTNLFLPL